jgi:predicted GNAT superfamily acetyltransferase
VRNRSPAFLGTLRPVRGNDAAELARVHEINQANRPAVGDVPLERLERFARAATLFCVIEIEAEVSAFLVALAPEDDYDSPNFLWFRERRERFLYVDRLAVDAARRRRGLGRRLYEHAFERARALGAPSVTCEVNLEPRNDESLEFHEVLGFRTVGEGWAKGHLVRYLERGVV